MTDDLTFTFRSGHTLRIRQDFNRQLLQLSVQQWKRNNPIPTPPTRQVPIKGGTREIVLNNDADYKFHLNVWLAAQNDFYDDARVMLSVDPASIDREIVKMARDYAGEIGLDLPSSDVLVYVQTVAQPGNGAAGDADFIEDERDLLEKFIDGVKGPSEALVTHLLKTRFRDNVSGNGHLAVQAITEG